MKAVIGGRFQQGLRTCRGLLCDCETLIIEKVRLQLYCGGGEVQVRHSHSYIGIRWELFHWCRSRSWGWGPAHREPDYSVKTERNLGARLRHIMLLLENIYRER